MTSFSSVVRPSIVAPVVPPVVPPVVSPIVSPIASAGPPVVSSRVVLSRAVVASSTFSLLFFRVALRAGAPMPILAAFPSAFFFTSSFLFALLRFLPRLLSRFFCCPLRFFSFFCLFFECGPEL